MKHKIKRGDTLWGLARKYKTTVEKLKELNPGINPKALRIGQEITIEQTVGDGAIVHVIKRGDTLSALAATYEVTLDEIEKHNPGIRARARSLQIGEKVVIRPEGENTIHTVKRGETLARIAENYGMMLDEIVEMNPQISNPNLIRVGQEIRVSPNTEIVDKPKEVQPVDYILKNFKDSRITSGYGYRTHPITGVKQSFHHGIDFGNRRCGDAFKNPIKGKVVFAQWFNGYGNTVVIECNRGLWHIFAHAASVSVKKGQSVNVGTPILNVGTTGNSTGCHVHYQINPKGTVRGVDAAMNPSKY